ncbi:OmpA family protein [Parasphingorhabdus halotolerans]|uniref:OmpA family protein n=1 Tax=Parasphingorhabdus halotolerans TaxID=2725558 RepID=A0A6H2DMZ1_9SPHN|nr:OmpA family protein [Parasphingorhabdus halotolerans]QJB69121.1 OmpA family protein [Parasphingorhabdus halotolerans]
MAMDVGGKILTGAAATALLAFVGHVATGDKLISGLEQKSQTELTAQGMDGVKVAFARDPLSRTAILDGDVADDVKQKAMAAVLAVPGVSSARWAGDINVAAASSGKNSAGDEANANDPATQEKIAKCQDGVDKTIEGKKLSFRSGSAYVSPASNKLLDEVAAALKPCAGLAIAVSGHTDDNGDAGVNKILSQERADRVAKGLAERGIAADVITATGYGAEKPLASGSGAAADAQNRRIEFKVQAKSANGGNNDAAGQQGE